MVYRGAKVYLFAFLRPHRPVRWYIAAILGFVILGFFASSILGLFWQDRLPEKVQAIASIPLLVAQPPVQHASRIFVEWN